MRNDMVAQRGRQNFQRLMALEVYQSTATRWKRILFRAKQPIIEKRLLLPYTDINHGPETVGSLA